MDTLNAADVQALNLLFQAGTQPKIEPFIWQCIRALEPLLAGKYRLDEPGADPFKYMEGAGIWKWFRHADKALGGWFIAWGLCVPSGFFEGDQFSKNVAGFIEVGCDDDKSPELPGNLLKDVEKKNGWRELLDQEARYVNIRDAAEMAGTAPGFTGEFLRWLQTGFRAADNIFERARSRLPKR